MRIVELIRSDEQDWVKIEIEMKKLLVLVLISRLVLRLLEAHTDWYQDFKRSNPLIRTGIET